MEIKEFTFRVMLIGAPGICCYFLLKKLIGKIGSDAVEAFLSIFVLSLICYAVTDIIALGLGSWQCFPWHQQCADFLKLSTLFGDIAKVENSSILWTCASAPLVALAISAIYHRKLWNRFAQRLKASQRFGDEDVFNYLLSGKPETNNSGWYLIRDHKEDLVYYATIDNWSDEGTDREMTLSNVDVYSNVGDARKLYSCATLYLCRNRDDISIEIPAPEQPKTENPTS